MASNDIVILDGVTYRRYPDSEIRNDRVYFKAHHHAGNPVYLHRVIYEKAHGAIPEGYHVHHIDGNPLNNDLTNLKLEIEFDHLSQHFKAYLVDPINRAKNLEHLKRINPKAAQWHGSDDGHELHVKLGHIAWNMRNSREEKCDFCGNTFTIKAIQPVRFCSNKCKSAWRRKSGVDNEARVCIICESEFIVNKYKKSKTCSRKCAGISESRTKLKRV